MCKYVLLLLGAAICAVAQAFEGDLIGGQWRMAGRFQQLAQPTRGGTDRSSQCALIDRQVGLHYPVATYQPLLRFTATRSSSRTGRVTCSLSTSTPASSSGRIKSAYYDGSSPNARSRTSPAIHGGDLIIGDIARRFRRCLHRTADMANRGSHRRSYRHGISQRRQRSLICRCTIRLHVCAERGHRQGVVELRQWRLGGSRACDRGRCCVLGLGLQQSGTTNNKFYAFTLQPRR
jgi:hypothetical protein